MNTFWFAVWYILFQKTHKKAFSRWWHQALTLHWWKYIFSSTVILDYSAYRTICFCCECLSIWMLRTQNHFKTARVKILFVNSHGWWWWWRRSFFIFDQALFRYLSVSSLTTGFKLKLKCLNKRIKGKKTNCQSTYAQKLDNGEHPTSRVNQIGRGKLDRFLYSKRLLGL